MSFVEMFSSLLILITTVFLCIYGYLSWKFKYFERKNLPYVPARFPMGNSLANSEVTISNDHSMHVYNELKGHRIGGVFQFYKPSYIVRDPELIKQIFIKDHDHFVDRSLGITQEVDAMFGGSLFNLHGKKWKDMRSTLSPAFTSSKMKYIFMLVSQCGQQIGDYLYSRSQEMKDSEPLSVEMRDLWQRYTIDVIATTGFGVKCDSLQDPTNEFYKIGKLVTDFSGLQGYIFLGYMINEKIMKFLGIPLTRPTVTKFLTSLVKETLTTREREGIVRPDMIQLLMQARKGELRSEAGEEDVHQVKGTQMKPELTDMEITAQVWNFFFAGTDTTTTLLCYVTNRVAVHEDVQNRMQEEIDSVLELDDDKLTYEGLMKMKYMDMVISETLRLFPPVQTVDRKCMKRYVIPATNDQPEVVLEEGESVSIPVYGLHYDPEYFPKPNTFNPERFSEENKKNIVPFTYVPFGVGPRNCIGMRLALLETKVALACLLSRFRLRPVEKTILNVQFEPFTFNQEIKFYVGVIPRNI